MSRFEGSVTITNNPGTASLVVVPISVNTRSALDALLINAATNGLSGAQNAVADWQGAVNAVNS